METRDRVVTTDDAITAAIAQSRTAPQHRVVSASYVADQDKISIALDDGVEVRLPRTLLQGLENATSEELSHIEIEGPGTGLVWPDVHDVAHYVPDLLNGVFGTRRYMQAISRLGGATKSAAKAAAAKRNGAKGGRPRQSTTT